jgi:hypothetical protein
MKDLVLMSLLLVSVPASARVLDLGGDCTVPEGFTPSEAQPFELDWCRPADRDDITGLLVQIANRWPSKFVVRAPSSDRTLISNTIDWGNVPVKDFSFLESPASAKLKVQHVGDPTDKYRMWRFANARRVIIGGTGLKITFAGNHPGLGTGDNTQAGLIQFETNDGSTPDLADFRANVWNAQSHGLFFIGGALGGDGEFLGNRFRNVNVSGSFVNSGIVINSGVRDAWFDPENLRVSDPYARVQGWDGVVAGVRPDGIRVGCIDQVRQQARISSGAGGQYLRRISGGVTLEYGTPNANIFIAKYIGDGPTAPYRVRFKDYGFTGPTELTGLPAGVMIKKGPDTTVMKHDPLPTYGYTAAEFRFIRFEQLDSDYGNGMQSGPINSGCAPGNATDNNKHTGTPYIWRPEASRDGVPSQYVTAFVDVTFDGLTEWVDLGNWRAYIQASGSGADIAPGPSVPDRTYGHVLRATARTKVPGVTTLLDTNTLTGPGSWYHVVIAPVPTDQGTLINPNDNRVVDTSIHGFVQIGANATGTIIKNVNFTGAARKIIEVGAGSDVVVAEICAPAGSTIEGTGAVTYQSTRVALPYTLSSAANQCGLNIEGVPRSPENVIVE